jgi:CPA1 family monovalent cation:H+ antiporter
MNLFAIIAMLITFTAVVAYVNERFLKLPTTIGVMVGGLVTSLLVIGAAKLGIGGPAWVESVVGQIDFNRLLMHGMLSFLLFAGALVTGGYAAAQHLHISGPLAMVMAGIVVGNQGRQLGMSEHTIVYMTYAVVVFSMLVQGLTVGRLAERQFGA